MPLILLILGAWLIPVVTIRAASDESDPLPLGPVLKDASLDGDVADTTVASNLTARQIMDNVLARFPREPLVIEGDLVVRRPRGTVTEDLKFQMHVNWGEDPARAAYILLDGESRLLEAMAITRASGQPPRMSYSAGNPPKPAALPDLYAPIRGTDMSWMDLTLGFLWWPGGTILGKEVILGYTCYMVELSAPAETGGGAGARSAAAYGKVKLWVEAKMLVLLQAEGYDSEGKAVRRLWVKSCKKINDRWMIKDMDIESYPTVHRTRLNVRDVNPSARAAEKPAS